MQVTENNISEVIEKINKRELKGINVTLPFKRSVIPYLSKTIKDAAETHSVNTVFLDDNNQLIGENTDVFGFQAAFLKSIPNLEKKSKKVLILGAGGVAPSIILALLKSNILDIGSNDGTCLKEFKKLGFEVYGVDPASAAANGRLEFLRFQLIV